MKKYIVISLFTYMLAFSKENINRKSSVDSILSILKAKVELNQNSEIKLKKLNEDLKNQLIIYKAKEDYFSVALEDQSNRFALIVSILVAALGLISFSWFKSEKKRINNKFVSFEIEFNKIKTDSKKFERKLLSTSGNAYSLIATLARKENAIVAAFVYKISAARDFYKSDLLEGKIEHSITLANLQYAKKVFEEIIKNDKSVVQLLEHKDNIFEDLNEIKYSDNDDIIYIAAEIRNSINSYLKTLPKDTNSAVL
jgi:hypothetical protein